MSLLSYLEGSKAKKIYILLPFEYNYMISNSRYKINKWDIGKSYGGRRNCYLFVIHDIFYSVISSTFLVAKLN